MMPAYFTLNKNGATSAKVTPLRIVTLSEAKMQDQDTTQPAGVLEACENLIAAAEQPHLIFRNSLWFEKSGDSLAVYNQKPRLYPAGGPPVFDGSHESAVACMRAVTPYIARVTLRDASYRAFLEGIDEYLMLRYLRGAA